MKKSNWKAPAIFILGTELVGLLAYLAAGNIKEVYASLTLPPLAPPSWLFGVVWTVLYALIGYAMYLVYKRREEQGQEYQKDLNLYNVQLAFNILWCAVFFRFKLFWAAAAFILVLDILVFALMRRFKDIEPKAGTLVIPYLVWLVFATYLNIAIAILN